MLSHSTGEAAKQVTRVMEEDIVLKLKEKITCHKNELECFYTAAAAPGSRVVSLDTWKEGLSMLLPGRSRTAEYTSSTAALNLPFASSSCALRFVPSFSAAAPQAWKISRSFGIVKSSAVSASVQVRLIVNIGLSPAARRASPAAMILGHRSSHSCLADGVDHVAFLQRFFFNMDGLQWIFALGAL
jgi:hypothetical protein